MMDETEAAILARERLARYDAGSPSLTADALRELWMRGVPQHALPLSPGQKAFFRDWGISDPEFAAAGTPVPILTAIGQEVARQAGQRVTDYLALVQILWTGYGREGRVVAAVALGPMELAEPDRVVPLLRNLARTCVFWEDCDQLAMKALEPILRRDPEAWLHSIGGWVHDDNKWVRRAALTAVGRLPLKKPALAERCVELVAPALGDSDTDVKRALSFALRVCARGDPEPVKRFIEAHRDATDLHTIWVLCDVIRSLHRPLLARFVRLLPVYEAWLARAEPRARRSVEAAVRLLERSQAAD